MPHFGIGELVIILFVILLFFGPGRIRRISGEMGKGIRLFKEGVSARTGKNEKPANKKAG